MTIHAMRGPASDPQLGLCMIAMLTLSTMYWIGSSIRQRFQKLAEKARMTTHHQQGYSSSSELSGFFGLQGEELPEFVGIYIGAGDAVVESSADHHDHEVASHNSEECWRDIVATQHPFGPPFQFK